MYLIELKLHVCKRSTYHFQGLQHTFEFVEVQCTEDNETIHITSEFYSFCLKNKLGQKNSSYCLESKLPTRLGMLF